MKSSEIRSNTNVAYAFTMQCEIGDILFIQQRSVVIYAM